MTNNEQIIKPVKVSRPTPLDDKPGVFFYYLRDSRRHIFGGACLKKVDGKWCRGISLWASKLDKFDRNHAKGLAYERVIQATKNKQNTLPVNRQNNGKVGFGDACAKLTYSYGNINKKGFREFTYKARYDAELSVAEKQIVKDQL